MVFAYMYHNISTHQSYFEQNVITTNTFIKKQYNVLSSLI